MKLNSDLEKLYKDAIYYSLRRKKYGYLQAKTYAYYIMKEQ